MVMKLTTFLFFAVFQFMVHAQNENYKIADGIIEYHDLFNASNNSEISCYRIPSIITTIKGNLVVAIDERVPSCGDLKWSKDINIVIRRSSDNGKTWSSIEKIVDFPEGQSASDPSMILDKITGEIFLFYNFMDLDKELNVYYFHVIKSNDNGKTWSQPEDITSQISKPEWHNDFKFITSGRGIQTENGILLHCLVNLESGMHVFGSKDHGKSWFFIDHPLAPADESKIVELSDNSLMVNSRTNNKGNRYVHTSNDAGNTWITTSDTELIDPSCNASIISHKFIEDGVEKNVLLFANANSTTKRENMTVKLSYDDGKTWSKGKTIYPGSSAYSSLTILKNGDIGLFFEKEDYKENVFVSFSFNWLNSN
jgi:sialidase-1